MKTDLVTSVIAAVAGVAIAYFVCSLLAPELEPVEFKVLSSGNSYDLTNPNEEVFNYRALNPTVEVYVGECEEYGSNGECVDSTSLSEDENGEDAENDENSEGGENSDLETPEE